MEEPEAPVPSLYEIVVAQISECEKLTDEVKAIAIAEIEGMKAKGRVNHMLLKDLKDLIGSPLQSLMTWQDTPSGAKFWFSIDVATNPNKK